MKIQKEPYRIDFIENGPEFVLRTTPNIVDGKIYSRTFAINALPNGQLIMDLDDDELTWTLSDDPGSGLWEMESVPTGAEAMQDSLESKVVYNPILTKEFTASCRIQNGQLFLKISAKEPGPHIITLRHDGNPLYITSQSVTAGKTTVPHQDYRIKAWFSIRKDGNWTNATPAMYLEESGGIVRVNADMLRSLFSKPDIPAWGEIFSAKPCPANTMKVRLMAGELWTDNDLDTSLIRTLEYSRFVTMVNGRLDEYAFANNIPDWNTDDDTHFYLKNGFDIFGQNNRETVIVPPGVEQYIYLYNYTTDMLTVRLQESATFADGTIDNNWRDETLTLTPGVNRVAIKEGDVVAWTVTISDDAFKGAVTLHYVVKEFEYGFHTFLMLNSLNLYESMPVEFLAREEQSEGERRIIAGVDSYGTTDRQTIFTARCLPRNASGLKLLRTAFAKQDNLLLEDKFAWYIDMIPGSSTIGDEGGDLTECEFKFRLREKVNRDVKTINVGNEIDPNAQASRTDSVVK